MGQKKIIPVSGEGSTSDALSWVTVATCTVSVNCSIMITDIWVNGTLTSTSDIATAKAEHRAKRVGGTMTVVGSIVYLITHNTGSDASLRSTSSRITISGNDILLQVRGITGAMTWYGGFTAILN